MKKKKWKSFLIASIAVLLIASIGIGIYAFLSDGDTANNRTTIGGVTTDIPEKFTPPDDIKPGDVITKDVKIRNTGKDDCYVRVRSLFSDSDMEKYCTVNYNSTDFTYNKNDGYYYYKKVLKKGETTPSLFTTVTISKNIPQDEIKKFDIIVYQESYQSYGFDSYQAAWDHYHRNQKN